MKIEVKDLEKFYIQNKNKIEVLKDVNFTVEDQQKVSIVGPSGGGKSTLLALLSGIDRPSRGTVTVNGKNLSLMSEGEMTEFRGINYGIVFQEFHLINHLDALENVMLPLEIQGISWKLAEEKARFYINEVGLNSRIHNRPMELSGGEAQRIAIARALVIEPKILLADEPSGNLDIKTGETIMNLLFSLVDKFHTTLLLVTHNVELSKMCEVQLQLESGSLKKIS